MASSNQSAKQYLKDAVENLVGQLKNLPLIFEKLQQLKIFSDNVINVINTETTGFNKTRKILDLVLNKGEEACYQFLRILDRERKSVLPNPNSSSQAPDLHTWICLFSFRDEAEDYNQGPISCHQLQHFMKKISSQILAEHWKQSLQFYGENIQENVTFIPLVLDTNTEKNTPYNKIKLKSKKCKKARSKKMKAYIPRDTQGKSPEELLKSREKNILIVGKPGIGKTTVVKQMLHHWAERNDRTLDFMFYFDENTLSNTSAAVTLEELLLSTFFRSNPQMKENVEEIMQYLQEYSERVTIVFDGINGDFLNNTVFLKIMENELLPEAKIVATCRSDVEYEFPDWPTCTIYVQGFSEESIYDFFNKMTDDPDLVDSVIKNPALFSLCHIPMYAFMVAACTLNNTSKEAQTPCTASEMYMWILSHCLKKLQGLGGYNKNHRDMVLSLAESAFNATKLKTINLELDDDENVIAHTFVKTSSVVSPAFDRHFCAFYHNTMQDFFSALWLLEKTEIIDEVLQLCQNEETQHMKYVIPFLCGLHGNRGIVDSWKSIPHLEGLFSLNKVKENTNAFFEKVLNTFFCDQPDDVDIAFICQCLYEFQSPEFCCSFLEKIDFCLDFTEEHLDPYTCCTVSYVISNSRNKQVHLNLEKSAVSLSGLKTILKYSQYLSFNPVHGIKEHKKKCRIFQLDLCLQAALQQPLKIQDTVQRIMPNKEEQSDILLDLYSHVKQYESITGSSVLPALLPVYWSVPDVWSINLSERKVSLLLEVLKLQTQKKPVELRDCTDEESEVKSFLQCLPYISQLRFKVFESKHGTEEQKKRLRKFTLDLCLQAALHQPQNIQETVRKVTAYDYKEQSDFLLDLFPHVKQYESETGNSVLPALLPVYQSGPDVWIINLSERKVSLRLEVLKLQTEKKEVYLRDCTGEESEVRSFLQCLPYISQLWFNQFESKDGNKGQEKRFRKFKMDLYLQAALHQQQNTQQTVEKVMTLFKEDEIERYDDEEQSDFLLDLCSYVKQYESETGSSVLPALLPVYQSGPDVWSINLSERKVSLILEVLKLQTQKKPVDLRDCTEEESEVRSFLQCLPYISQLRFWFISDSASIRFLLNLSIAAVDCQSDKGENFTELLASVCSYNTFPFGVEYDEFQEEQSDFLLDLYFHVKQYERETGSSVLPAFLPVYQSVSVWSIDLSERKVFLLLEVLKLQTQKKLVELRDCTDEESEVRNFLQCLRYISQLRFTFNSDSESISFLLNLSIAAVDCQSNKGENFTELLASVCSYNTFPFDGESDEFQEEQSDFLLNLYSHVKQYESETGSSVLPAFLPVYQSVPDVWSINLSERKVFLLLEVLKLQTQKKPVELRNYTDEESEVRSFLQCLRYISQLRLNSDSVSIRFLLNLSIAAVDCQSDKGENFTELLASVCSYNTFPFGVESHGFQEEQSDFLLDLYSHVKQYESETGSSVLPALLTVYQSGPDVWSINLSERKVSLLLEVLKLQTQKKPVVLRNYIIEESEVRSFLQCLRYISQLRCSEKLTARLSKAVVENAEDTELVKAFFAATDSIFIIDWVLSTRECRAVRKVLKVSDSNLKLTLTPRGISLRGLRLLFSHRTHLQKLCLSGRVVQRMVQAFRAVRSGVSVVIDELCMDLNSITLNKTITYLSSLCSLLNIWTVHCVNLSECRIDAHSLISLMCHPGHLQIRLSKETLQQFTDLLCEVRDGELTHVFLEKMGGDLTSCSLSWEKLIHFLQQRVCRINVNIRKSKIEYNHARQILPLLSEVQFKRLNPSVLPSVIREIYETRSADCVSGLLSSTHSCINLSNTELDSYHSTALHFTLQHSTSVCLNLLWTSIQEEDLMKILPLFNKVSQLSVDRVLLLKMLHCCSKSDLQKGAATAVFSALKNRLDFSCSTGLDLTTETEDDVLYLSTEDCRDISTAIQNSHQLTELILKDCQIEDAALDLFFPVLHTVRLRCSKPLLLQFLALLHVVNESECVRHVRSLSQALDGELDLSETPLDLHTYRSLALFLEFTEGLSELDLSHCKLSEHGLELLFPHLHKTAVLDLSHNAIDDYLAGRIYTIVSTSSNIQTVRLFNNRITDKEHFQKDKRFEIW
ncbi:hypothetical protein C0J50_18785 [Silurus asotus]|uniref:Uncharacterized protein n=1 Tax=Silurus asotus TaxID=30991 RepID=A0AAD5ARU6_SILAS|nr:hypothetical protein C0J50_18785 [Silurus asotus]